MGLKYLFFPISLILPCLAVIRTAGTFGIGYTAGYLTLISVVTLLAYRSDKRRAERNAWRIPEATLHLLELLGGWAAAFCAQRIFHHKTSKRSYQFTFWLIAVVHQYLAFDCLRPGALTGSLTRFAESLLN